MFTIRCRHRSLALPRRRSARRRPTALAHAALAPWPRRSARARAALGERLQHRAEVFLATARRGIFAHPRRPYARLFALAGCEYGDLARLVHGGGLEGALATLFRRGVYLTGALDERALADAFLQGLAGVGDAERVAQLQWREAGWLGVRRARPQLTAAGKILHLHHRRGLPA